MKFVCISSRARFFQSWVIRADVAGEEAGEEGEEVQAASESESRAKHQAELEIADESGEEEEEEEYGEYMEETWDLSSKFGSKQDDSCKYFSFFCVCLNISK